MGSLMSFFGGLCGKKKIAGEYTHTHTHTCTCTHLRLTARVLCPQSRRDVCEPTTDLTTCLSATL